MGGLISLTRKAAQGWCREFTTSPIYRLIPDASLVGACPTVKIFNIQTQHGKTVNGGMLISASVHVPYSIRRDQVKPTILACIRELKRRNKKCEWIHIFLCVEGRKIYAGRGEYKSGEIRVSYGIPSQKQLASLEDVKPLNRGDFDKAADISDLFYAYDGILAGQDLKKARKGKVWNQDIYNSLMDTRDARIYSMISDQLQISAFEVRRLKRCVMNYYMLTWGDEIIR